MTGKSPATLLAIDFGLKHIGLAVGQRITGTASPLTVIRARDGIPDWPALDRIIAEWRPDQLVVGLPLNMDDSAGDMVRTVERFANRLRGRYHLPVSMVDERLTSHEARERSRDRDEQHAIAAQLIAQTWLAGTSSGDDAQTPR